jgi:hypothetical protein
MAKQSELVVAADDPRPALQWEVIYSDRFDRETSPSVEVEGRGLVPGLAELWARFLFETVQVASFHRDGAVEEIPSRGFSEFWLSGEGLRLEIDGSLVGAHRLKRWVFEATDPLIGIVANANATRLRMLAEAHARAGSIESAALAILDAAEAALDVGDLEHQLGMLRRRWEA